MEIPMLSKFIEGLKLFFSTKSLRWLTLVFIVSAVISTIISLIQPWLPTGIEVVIFFFAGTLPLYFLLASLVFLFGFQRFVISEEDYMGSFVRFIVWYVISAILLLMMIIFAQPVFLFIFVIFGFLGWIVFQAFMASRSSLGYAESIDVGRGKVATFLFSSSYILNYIVIFGAFIGTWIFINPGIILVSPATFVLALVGTLFAGGFNFINGFIMIKERNKRSVDNIALLGIFISFYSAYFIYNVLSGATFGSIIANLPDIAVTVFFLLYAISNVGLTVTSRSEMDTRWKVSKEVGGAFTFFLASSYTAVIMLFHLFFPADPIFAAGLGNITKLLLFPAVALIMEIIYIRRWRKPPAEEEPLPADLEEPEVLEEETLTEEVEEPMEPIEEEPETPLEEPVSEPEEPAEETPFEESEPEESASEEEESSEYGLEE